jgi:hypothetical protein
MPLMVEAPPLRPRSLIELLDAAFRLYRENAVTFAAIAALVYVPAAWACVLFQRYFAESVLAAADQVRAQAPTKEGCALLLLSQVFYVGVSGIALSFSTGMLAPAVDRILAGERVGVAFSVNWMRAIFWRYLWTTFMVAWLVSVGLVLFMIPGLLLAIQYSLASITTSVEGTSGSASLRRSRELIRGSLWRTAGLWILMGILIITLLIGVRLAGQEVIPLLARTTASRSMILQAVHQVASLFMAPFLSCAWILFYYDCRIRREAFDLERRMPPAAPPPSSRGIE